MQSASTQRDPSNANVIRATKEVDLIVLVSTSGTVLSSFSAVIFGYKDFSRKDQAEKYYNIHQSKSPRIIIYLLYVIV